MENNFSEINIRRKTMKKIISVLLCVLLLASLLPVSAFAATTASGTCGDNLTWTLDGDGTLTISGTGAMKNYDPSNNDTTAPWGKNCSLIKSVVISDGVTSIGDYAFSGCSNLTSVTIPHGVTSIEICAFSGCSSLTSVTIPDSVTSIGDYAFIGCSSLTSVTIPDGVTSIGERAFYGCSSLTSMTIPDSVTSIGDYVFCDCSSLTSVTIGNSVKSIGGCAFYKCSSLTSVTIPDSVTSIGYSAFYGCSSLTSVTIPDSVTSIGVSAFLGCSKIKVVNYDGNIESWLGIDFADYGSNPCTYGSTLYFKGELVTNAVIPDSITRIKNRSFYGCSSLTSVTIPDSVTSIGDYAFDGCSSLTSVTMPDSVTSIGGRAFYGCDKLKDVYYNGNIESWLGIDFADYGSNPCTYGSTLYFKGELVTNAVIPDSITSIKNWSFYGCSSLTSMTIPDSVTSIGDYAFCDCSSLTSVTIPDSVTSIGRSAFYGCSSLTSVTIPDSVTSIGDYAFDGCSSLTSVTIPDSVTSIGNSAFRGCSSLTSVTIPDSVTSIGDYAFYNCSSLTSVTIPDSMTSIGDYAFWECSKLKDIAFAGSKDAWASIEKVDEAFLTSPRIHYNCTTLEGHIIPMERKDPSCTSTGYIKYSCACGYEYTELLPENHDYVFIKSVAATCSNAGYDVYKCSKCGKILNKSNGEEQLPHEYEFTKVVEPTCLKGGYTLYKCSVCGDEYKDNLTPLLGHSMVEVGEKPATCTEAGHTAGVQCSRCGLVESGVTEIPAIGHSYGNWTQTKAPTCTAKGTETGRCTRCNATETRDVEALGHNTTHHAAKAATCTEAGWEAYDTCSRCDYTTYKEIPATGHSYTSVVTEPTCTAQGYTTYTCSCGDSYVADYKDALGHSFGEWKQTKAPTCTANGTEVRTCTRCNATETRDVEALGHNTTHHAAKAATCTEIGWEAYDTCSRCDYTTYKEIPATGHHHNAVVTAPTCTAKGYTTHTCACGDSYVDSYTNALGHSYKNGVCTRCGATEEVVASGTCGNDLTWTLDSNGTLTISGTGEMGKYSWGKSPWYAIRNQISEVVIENGATSIGKFAFESCENLRNISIPNTVKSIGVWAFSYSGVEDLFIPLGVESIGDHAFNGCESLKSINVADDNPRFSSVEGVLFNKDKTVLIRFPVISSIKQYEIPSGVTTVYYSAFDSCNGIEEVVFPNSIQTVHSCFESCTTIKSISIPNGITTIENCMFEGCSNLTSVTLPNSITSIGISAFLDCKSLKNVILPNELTQIDMNAFQNCTSLESVFIPLSVTHIGQYAFDNCAELKTIYYEGVAKQWEAIDIRTDNDSLTTADIIYDCLGSHIHSYTEEVTAPTCTEGGYTTYTCSECGDSYVDDYVDSLDHDLKHHAAKAATCTEKGWEAYDTCNRCDYTTYKEIPATGHHHNAVVTAPTCTAKGYTTHTCACGDSYVDSYTNALGHSYGAWTQTKAPTCTEKGTEVRTCTRCNATETRDVEALGHSYGNWTQTKAPTCTAKGTETKTCTRCNASETRDVNALGHSYANGKCTRCGAADPNYKPAPKAPELKITTSAGKPKIYWNAVDGAVKYWVYRSTDGKNFKYYDSTTKTSYTNNSTSIGTTYYYKVKAVAVVDGKDYASDYSVIRSILCKPAAPTVSINRSNGKPKLSWKAVSGATKYWIYRSTDGKEFKYFDSTTKTSYTNSGAASGTKYYYRVKAVAVVNGKNVTSANSSTKSLFTSLAKPSVSITTSNGKPKLTWKAVTGADKYYVYRSTDGKNFSYWDSTTKTSYVNSGAKKNTKYYYKVKAVCASNSNANSAQSAAVSIKATK